MTEAGRTTDSDEQEMAAWRDASWYDSPGTAGRFHVVNGDAKSAVAACCSWRLLDGWDQLTSRPLWRYAAEIPEHRRCRRNGCRQRWPAR